MGRKVTIITIASVLIAAGGYFWWSWRTSPECSLSKIQQAVKTHDIDLFEKHVDVDGVTSSLIDELLSWSSKGSKSSYSYGSNLIAQGIVELARPTLLDVAHRKILEIVETGKVEDDHGDSRGSNESPVLGVFDFWARRDGQATIGYVKKDGKLAYVGVAVPSSTYDTVLYLDMKLRDKGGYWQLSGFSNLSDFLSQIDSLEYSRVKRINGPILSEFYNTAVVCDWKYEKVYNYYVPSRVDVKMELCNKGEKTIEMVDANFLLVTELGDTLGTFGVFRQDPLPPGKSAKFAWSRDVNTMDASMYTDLFMSNIVALQALSLNRVKYEGEATQSLEQNKGLSLF